MRHNSTDVENIVDSFFLKYPKRLYSSGEILMRAGEEAPGVFYVLRGQVRQYDISAKGDETVVNIFNPPSFFPIGLALSRDQSTYFYDAYDDVITRLAPIQDTLAFLAGHPEVVLNLLDRLYVGIDGMERRMVYIMQSDSYIRVVYELIIECKRFGKIQPDGSYSLRMHEDELANRAGLSRETVSREISKLTRLGLVSVTHKLIVVHEITKLEELLPTTTT